MADSPIDRMRAEEDALQKAGTVRPTNNASAAAADRALSRIKDEAFLNAESDRYEVLTPQKQAERDRIRAMREESEPGMSNSTTSPSFNTSSDAADGYSAEQSTEQAPRKQSDNNTDATSDDTPPSIGGMGSQPPVEITDVVADFDWTASINKQQMAEKIPYIRLTEYKITANNTVNSFGAALMSFADEHRSSVAGVSNLGSKFDKISQGSFLSGAGKSVGSAVAKVGSFIAPHLKKAEDYVRGKTNDGFGHEGQHLVDLFGNLYARASTGRTYILPYFSRDYTHAGNAFSDTTEDMPPVAGTMQDGIKAAGAVPTLTEPGVYVQRPKFYQFAAVQEPTVRVTLTLYNTISPMAYMKNAKLIQQLAINNLPRRITRVVVEPPCIYEVLIPGKAFYPYCFISNMHVANVGTRRLLNGEIVPDAFQIELTLTSLTKDDANYYDHQMQHHGLGSSSAEGSGGGGEGGSSGGGLADGGGDGMGDSGAQRDSIAGQPSGTTGSADAGKSAGAEAGSEADSNARVEKTILSLRASADRFDQLAEGYDRSGNKQKAAEMRAEAASSRNSAAMMRSHLDSR